MVPFYNQVQSFGTVHRIYPIFLFNSRLKLFLGKLKSRWSGPFIMTRVHLYEAVELIGIQGNIVKVNG